MSTAAAPETDYIAYLEAQLEKSDHERMLVINQMDGLSRNFGELSSLRSTLADRTHQLAITQQQLTQEGLLVQEEREKVARLMNENAVLCAQSDDDRAKIASLIRLRRGDLGVTSAAGLHPSLLGGPAALSSPSSPVGTEGYYAAHLHKPSHSAYQDKLSARQRAAAVAANGGRPLDDERCIPAGHVPIRVQTGPTAGAKKGAASSMSLRAVVTDYANAHPHTLNANRDAVCGGGGGLARHSSLPQQAPQPGCILTSAPAGGGGLDVDAMLALQPPLSSQLVATLSSEVETYKTLLDEQRRAYENERSRRLHDERRRHDELIAKDRGQVATIASLQNDVQLAVKELVLYRHQQQIVERALRGEIEMLKVSCVETQRTMTHMSNRKTQDLALALEMATTRTQDQMTKLRSEMAEKRALHFTEKETLLAAIVRLREENDKLQKDLAMERTNRKRAEDRLKLEKQGAQSEVGLLKHHLRAIEKKIYFSHAKGASREESSAQLIASLMAQQVAAQRQLDENNANAADADGGH